MPKGWILDIHPDLKQDGKMVIWLKQRNGEAISVMDNWRPSIFVYSHYEEDLNLLLQKQEINSLVSDFGFEYKITEITDREPKRVLRLTLKNARDVMKLAKLVYYSAPYATYQIYNTDIDPAQIYMYEHDLFPLAFVEAYASNGRIKWNIHDAVDEIDYELPNFTQLQLKTRHYNKTGKLVKVADPIRCIELNSNNDNLVVEGDEEDILLQLVKHVKEIDPDLIFTNDGDSFVVPNLLHRAAMNGLGEKLVLGRYNEPVTLAKQKGATYVSYGKTIYKPRHARFFGRIHIDISNTFVYGECELDGVIEVARTCRVPLDTAARASIGRIMTSAEFYNAYKRNILIPWKPTLAERFKSALDLMIGDRGGFIFEPRVGVHDNVGEIDFSSLYPTLMFRYNISAETIGCDCCPDSRTRVPELNCNICEKQIGIIPRSLELLLSKRRKYNELKSLPSNDNNKVYHNRQNALKWILVSCFGYLGFRNAKFGRIDAHMAVCAFARKTLFDAVHVAENNNAYEVVHGIVDALWLKKRNTAEEDYEELCCEIRKETGLPISFDGIYKWVAFLPSKVHNKLPVTNRYFGVFRSGKVKVRGIEARKHDTPQFIKKCQLKMIEAMARYANYCEVKTHLDEPLNILLEHVRMLEHGEVSIEDLTIRKSLSKGPMDYRKDIVQAIVSKQLIDNGREINAGQTISYIITDFYNKNPDKRASHIDLFSENKQQYDVRKYSEMLVDSAETILNPFGITNPLQTTLFHE